MARAHTLTAQQEAVVELLADGYKVDEVAKRMFISPATVRSHIIHARWTVNANNVTHLVAIWLRSPAA